MLHRTTQHHLEGCCNACLLLASACARHVASQIWAGSKQKELRAGSMQLLHQYLPLAALMLASMVASLEPVGLLDRRPDTLLGVARTRSIAALNGHRHRCARNLAAETTEPRRPVAMQDTITQGPQSSPYC